MMVPNCSALWLVELGEQPTQSPLVVGDLLLVTTQEAAQPPQRAALKALALAKGELRWQQSFEHALVSGLETCRVKRTAGSPETRQVLVSLSSIDLLRGQGALLLLDTSGQQVWRWSPGVQKVSAPAITDDTVYVTADARTLYALDLETGMDKSWVELPASASLSAPALSGGVSVGYNAYIPCRSPHLLAVSLDGKLLWQFTLNDAPDAWLDKTPAVVDETVYAASSTGLAVAVRTGNGMLVWQMNVGPTGKSLSAPATDGERLFVGARDGLHALDLASGREAWACPTERTVEAAPVVMGSVVYCASHDHRLRAFDAATGRELWRHSLAHRIEVAPLVTAPDHPSGPLAIAADHSGTLVALQRPLSAQEHEQAGHWVEAASAYADLGQPAHGAELLQAHGEPFKAAELWKAAGQLERAVEQYTLVQAWPQVAEAWQTLGQPLKRAEALAHYARTLDDTSCVAVWQVAAEIYAAEDEAEQAAACQREISRCLQLPIIAVDVRHEGLVLGAWSRLQFIVRNEGFGPARNLVIHAKGDQFEGQVAATRQIATLQDERERSDWLDVRPRGHGKSVPLRVAIEYEDSAALAHVHEQTVYIAVARTEADRGAAQIIHINTGGGAALVGSTISTGGGDFVGRDRAEPASAPEQHPSQTAARPGWADLELRISARREKGYPVEITLDGEQHFAGGYLPAEILPWSPSGDLATDGRRLFEILLADNVTRDGWNKARGQSPRCRIRLRLDVDAPELHALPWEALHDGHLPLSASVDTPFSRYLPIDKPWGGPVRERPVRLLVAIPNPRDLTTRHNLPPVDVDLERRTLEAAFAAVGQDKLVVEFLPLPVTLKGLEAALPHYHGLHLVCHGAYSSKLGQAALYLENAEGNAERVLDEELAGLLARQGVQPRLVFLSACQSAVRAPTDAFLGLGPKLVAQGVPAVVAMQGLVTMDSAREFSARFYSRLLEHGRVDVAMNEARSTLLALRRPDAAVPVLFMRLKSGQLWGESVTGSGVTMPPQSGQAPAAPRSGRAGDLERLIRESYDIIREYDDIIQISDRPEEVKRAKRAIEKQWNLIKGYLDEYTPLCRKLGLAPAQDVADIAAHFATHFATHFEGGTA